jgi:hypothetical protein
MAHYEVSTDPIAVPVDCGCVCAVNSLECCDPPVSIPQTLFLEVVSNTCTTGYWAGVTVGTIYQVDYCFTDSNGSHWYGYDFGTGQPCVPVASPACRWLMLGAFCFLSPGTPQFRAFLAREGSGCDNAPIIPVLCSGAGGDIVTVSCDFTFPVSGLGLVFVSADDCCENGGVVGLELMD